MYLINDDIYCWSLIICFYNYMFLVHLLHLLYSCKTSYSLSVKTKCSKKTASRSNWLPAVTFDSHVHTYSASQKSNPPPPETFCSIFTLAKYISVKFCQFVSSLYSLMLTNFARFILIFNKMALIFLGVLIVFTVSSFNKSDCLDLIANEEWPQFIQPQLTGLSGLGAMLEC